MIFPLDVPVTPGADEARDAVTRELAKPIYDTSTSLLDRILQWLSELLQSLFGNTTGTVLSRVVVAVLIVLIIAAIVLAGPVARARRARQASPAVLADDDTRTARAMREAAQRARQAGDLALAVLEYYRALARDLEERTILDDRPGRTAREVALEAGSVLPDLAADLTAAAALFDLTYYGRRTPSVPEVEHLAALVDRAGHARPARVTAEVGV